MPQYTFTLGNDVIDVIILAFPRVTDNDLNIKLT